MRVDILTYKKHKSEEEYEIIRVKRKTSQRATIKNTHTRNRFTILTRPFRRIFDAGFLFMKMNLFRMGNPTIVTMKLLISEIFLASYKKSADPSTSALSFSIVIM